MCPAPVLTLSVRAVSSLQAESGSVGGSCSDSRDQARDHVPRGQAPPSSQVSSPVSSPLPCGLADDRFACLPAFCSLKKLIPVKFTPLPNPPSSSSSSSSTGTSPVPSICPSCQKELTNGSTAILNKVSHTPADDLAPVCFTFCG